MPDDSSKIGRFDRKRVAGGQNHEVANLAKKTGKSPEAVRKAAKKAGPSRAMVERELKGS